MKEPNRYIRFASWESLEAIQAWKGSPEFKQRIGKVKEHTAAFTAAELELQTKVPAGERAGAT